MKKLTEQGSKPGIHGFIGSTRMSFKKSMNPLILNAKYCVYVNICDFFLALFKFSQCSVIHTERLRLPNCEIRIKILRTFYVLISLKIIFLKGYLHASTEIKSIGTLSL